MVRVILQERQQLFRAGLTMHMEAAGMDVIATVETPGDVLEVDVGVQAEVVVLDAQPVTELLVRRIRRAHPKARVVGLPSAATAASAPSRCAGFDGIVPCQDGIAGLITEIRAQAAGGPPATRHRAVPHEAARRPEPVAVVSLTRRELTILDLIAGGGTTAEMAALLQISRKTVENHKQSAFAKLGVQNQAHAVSLAVRGGLLSPLATRSAV